MSSWLVGIRSVYAIETSRNAYHETRLLAYIDLKCDVYTAHAQRNVAI